jgi:putative ABC transport system permease protein
VEDAITLQERLGGVEGVTGSVGRISTGGKIYLTSGEGEEAPAHLNGFAMGIDFPAEEAVINPKGLLIQGVLPQMGSREAALGAGLAAKAGLEPGDTFTFMTLTAGRAANAMTFTVTGLLHFPMGAMGKTHFLIPLDTMQYFLRMPGGVQEILVMTEDPENALVQEEAIRSLLSAREEYNYLSLTYWKRYGQFYPMMGVASLTYNVMVLFFLILGATLIINTTMMVIYERYREIGILGALGMKPKELVKLFFLEGLWAGLISAGIGLLLGILLVLLLEKTGINFGAAYNNMNMEVSSVIYPDLTLLNILLMGIYTVGITALVTLLPARKAAAIEPDQAIRST